MLGEVHAGTGRRSGNTRVLGEHGRSEQEA
jgi:hypothetical protein